MPIKIHEKILKKAMKYLLDYYGIREDVGKPDIKPYSPEERFIKSGGLHSIYINVLNFDMAPFIRNGLLIKVTFVFIRMMESIKRARKAYRNELESPKGLNQPASADFWDEVVKKAESLGVGLIGFAPVERDFIFANDHSAGIDRLYKNGIVLGMAMNFDAIETAPGPRAGLEALNIYAKLGDAAIRLADFIREKGHNAIACHPFGGPILYPAMAVKAGIGEMGRSGLLITRKYGPRLRLAMVTTDASPLPVMPSADLTVAKFCEKCGKCIDACPGKAILGNPILKDKNVVTRIDSEKCFHCFYPYDSCSICIKVCPFNRKTGKP